MARSSFTLKKLDTGWLLSAGNLELHIDRATGCVGELAVTVSGRKTWMAYPGDVAVRDDLLQRTFGRSQLQNVEFEQSAERLLIRKTFNGTTWILEEIYQGNGDALSWEAQVHLHSGEFRSCAISWHLPWPQPIFPVSFWAAKEKMPSMPSRFAGISLEYGEITSGIMMPVLSCYRNDTDSGVAIAMPFDFRTPRFRFVSGFRDPDLRVEFDWLALSPAHSAKAALLLHGTVGDWRPALGWIYKRFTEYFEPRSKHIDQLWGGHICGKFTVSPEELRLMTRLGIKWYEIHEHFPAYGNYHPENLASWRSGHALKDTSMITEDILHQTMQTLHQQGVAAMPYIQVTGDGDEKLLDPMLNSCRIRNLQDETWGGWPGTLLMNSDPSLPFGKDITRQIDGMLARYPEMDGVFLDQACYNFLDTAHDDGITAVNNRPASMTGFNYFPHLEHLSRLLHPERTIIANGPYGAGILKYLDGFMAEAEEWLCDHLQYFSIGTKPLFFLVYQHDDAHIEKMFQSALLYAAGFASYPAAMPSKDLYDLYCPLLEKLYRRRWVFDPRPLQVPAGFKGNVYRGENGSLYVSLIRTMTRLPGRAASDGEVRLATSDIDSAKGCVVHQPGQTPHPLSFTRENGAIRFTVPTTFTCGLIEATLGS